MQGHDLGAVAGPSVGRHHGDEGEGVQGEDADVDDGGGDVVSHHGCDDLDGGAQPAGTVDACRLEDLGGDRLDRRDEQHHVEADEGPDHREGHSGQGEALIAEPSVVDLRDRAEAEQTDHRVDGAHDEVEEPVQQATAGVVDEVEQDARDDGRDGIGEEADDAIEPRPAHAADAAVGAAADGHHDRQREGERDRDRGQQDEQDQVVAQRLPEDGVAEDPLVVLQSDEVHRRAEARPVRQRVVERLQERRDDEHEVDDEREPQEHQEEQHPLEGGPTTAAAHDRSGRGRRLVVPDEGIGRGHEPALNFVIESSSRTASIMACCSSARVAESMSPLRNFVQLVIESAPRPYQSEKL